MINTTTTSSDSPRSFTNLEKTLFCGIGVIVTLFIVQSLCFIVCLIRVKNKIRRKHDCSLISNVREPLSNKENKSERYSFPPLKQVSNPQIYESLKDLIPDAAPPLPSINTLPKRKPVENFEMLETLSNRYADAGDNEVVNSKATRPRLPLPNETEVSQMSSKENIFATMPRLTFPKPVPTPITSSTLARYPNSNNESPHTNTRNKRFPKKTEIPPPQRHQSTLSSASHHITVVSPQKYRTLPKPRSPVEVQNKSTLLPSEPNHEIPVDNELLQKLKKRAQLMPLSPQEITNKPTSAPAQHIKHEPYIHNELMQKLKKRAASLPPTPRHSDYKDGMEDNFDFEPFEQIHTYNI